MNLYDIVAPLTIEEAKTDYQKKCARDKKEKELGENAWNDGSNSWTSDQDQWAKESAETVVALTGVDEDGLVGPDSTSPVGGHVDEARLQVGDPVIVTAPNAYEGKTGEISEFSPSGKFVIVNLYNHGEHSMHLSDVEYNQYADDEDADEYGEYEDDIAEGDKITLNPIMKEGDDHDDLDAVVFSRIDSEKKRLADLKKNNPEAYAREMAKEKSRSRIPPVSTFEEQDVAEAGLGMWGGGDDNKKSKAVSDYEIEHNKQKQAAERARAEERDRAWWKAQDDASKAGKDSFEFDGKSHPVKEQGVKEGIFDRFKTPKQDPKAEALRKELMLKDRETVPDMDDYSWQIGWHYGDGNKDVKAAYSDAYYDNPTIPSPPEPRSFKLGFDARKKQGVAEEVAPIAGTWIAKYWDKQPENTPAEQIFRSEEEARKFLNKLPPHYVKALRPAKDLDEQSINTQWQYVVYDAKSGAVKSQHNTRKEAEDNCNQGCKVGKRMAGTSFVSEQGIAEVKQRLDAKCWAGKHKEGTKIKGGVRVNNCVPNESVEEGWRHKPTGGELNTLIMDYADAVRDAFEYGDYGHDDESQEASDRASEILGTIRAKFGDEAVEHARKAGDANTFGREGNTHGHGEPDSLTGGLRHGKSQDITKAGKIPKNTQNAMKNTAKNYGRSRINGPQGVLPESKNDDYAGSTPSNGKIAARNAYKLGKTYTNPYSTRFNKGEYALWDKSYNNEMSRLKKKPQSVAESYWTRLQNEKNTRLNSLVNELSESVKNIK